MASLNLLPQHFPLATYALDQSRRPLSSLKPNCLAQQLPRLFLQRSQGFSLGLRWPLFGWL
jgi:hypothetical protein